MSQLYAGFSLDTPMLPASDLNHAIGEALALIDGTEDLTNDLTAIDSRIENLNDTMNQVYDLLLEIYTKPTEGQTHES